jgi:hypothetical protein
MNEVKSNKHQASSSFQSVFSFYLKSLPSSSLGLPVDGGSRREERRGFLYPY